MSSGISAAPLLVAGLCLASAPLPASAAQDANPDAWQFSGELYLWGAQIDSTTPGGSPVTLTFSDILDNLNMALMGVFAARRDKWTFAGDVIYMDLSHRKDFALSMPPISGSARAEMTSWIFTPVAMYNVAGDGHYRVDIVGGLRYVDVEAKLKLDLTGPGGLQDGGKDSFSDWNAIVGARGRLYLNEHWYLGGYADVGTGESDLTWQAVGTVGYKFDRLEINGGYRYLAWNFDTGSNNLMDDLSVKGPFAGVAYTF